LHQELGRGGGILHNIFMKRNKFTFKNKRFDYENIFFHSGGGEKKGLNLKDLCLKRQ
jgi:hypothetical protein